MSFPEYELIEPSRLRPELRKVATPSLDEVIVEFLKQYEVNVIPITAQGAATSAGTNAMLGAVGGVGMAMANAALTGQERNAAAQEWTQWKQWALDHKEFSAFKEQKLLAVKAHNEKVEELLTQPEIQQELRQILAQGEGMSDYDKKSIKFLLALLACFLVASLLTNLSNEKDTDDQSLKRIQTEQERIERGL